MDGVSRPTESLSRTCRLPAKKMKMSVIPVSDRDKWIALWKQAAAAAKIKKNKLIFFCKHDKCPSQVVDYVLHRCICTKILFLRLQITRSLEKRSFMASTVKAVLVIFLFLRRKKSVVFHLPRKIGTSGWKIELLPNCWCRERELKVRV